MCSIWFFCHICAHSAQRCFIFFILEICIIFFHTGNSLWIEVLCLLMIAKGWVYIHILSSLQDGLGWKRKFFSYWDFEGNIYQPTKFINISKFLSPRGCYGEFINWIALTQALAAIMLMQWWLWTEVMTRAMVMAVFQVIFFFFCNRKK